MMPKMSGCGFVARKSFFLNDEFCNIVDISDASIIEGVVVGVPNKECIHWTLHQYNESLLKKNLLHYFWTQMKQEKSNLNKQLFDAFDEYDVTHQNAKRNQQLARYITHHRKNEIVTKNEIAANIET